MEKRKVSQLTFAEHPDQGKKCWIPLSGCNFNCNGCISISKEGIGRLFSVDELVDLILKSCKFLYKGEKIKKTCITGGEPLLSKDYFLHLLNKLKSISVKKFELSTNGYFLDEELLKELCSLKIDLLVKLDLKAYTNKIHKEYTGVDNTNILNAVSLLSKYGPKLHKQSFPFVVRTVYMPDIFGLDEIEKIAKFLNKEEKNVCFRIQQFSPIHGRKISRRPSFDEMLMAYNIARKYLENVIVSTYLPTRPEYNYVEIRDDRLIEMFKEIDRKSKTVIESWNVKYFTMNQILKWAK